MATVNTSNGTYLTNLFNPQVVGDLIRGKLTNNMVFMPITQIDYTLEGRAGNTITVPTYAFIGEAAAVNEGADIPLAQLSETTDTATIIKLGKAVQITDEAALSGYGDPIGEAANQIALALDGGNDTKIYDILHAISGTYLHTAAAATLSTDDINNALVKFGEKLDGVKYLFVNPADYAILRKTSAWLPASEIAADAMVRGVVGEIYGCRVIVSNKLTTDNESFIVKEGAFRTFLKRGVNVEFDRDILNKSTVIAGDLLAVNYLYDKAGAIRIKKGSGS